MKKKIFALALVLSVLLSACGGSPASDSPDTPTESVPVESDPAENAPNTSAEDEPSESTPVESELPASTGNILLDSELIVHDVMNGSGTEVIGQYAYIKISAEQLKETTSDALLEFAQNRVENSGYNWVSIVTNNGNGIIFTGSDIVFPTYGKLSEKDKELEETIGSLRLSDGVYTYSES